MTSAHTTANFGRAGCVGRGCCVRPGDMRLPGVVGNDGYAEEESARHAFDTQKGAWGFQVARIRC